VVLCNPFGEEALRAHRIYRVLARKLAEAGYPTLRFDYSGSGDSFGDSAAATLESWTVDVRTAVDEVRRLTRVTNVVSFGLRLGASVALQAAVSGGVRHVVACDPVVNGAEYLTELSALHADYMFAETGRRIVAEPQASRDIGEALGHPLSARLRQELAELELAKSSTLPVGVGVTVISNGNSPQLDALRSGWKDAATRWVNLGTSEAWNSDAALNRAVVPMNLVREVVLAVQTASPS
jgi:uncharacterized protein